MANPNAATPKPTSTPPAAKVAGKKFNAKLKGADNKWATLGTLFMRDDGSGGVLTLYANVKELFAEGVERLDKIAIFINDRPPKAA